jgi:hypothetical protein
MKVWMAYHDGEGIGSSEALFDKKPSYEEFIEWLDKEVNEFNLARFRDTTRYEGDKYKTWPECYNQLNYIDVGDYQSAGVMEMEIRKAK